VKGVNERLKASGYEIAESFEVRFRPDEQDLEKCHALGEKIASLVKANGTA
jgi:flavorubredoxin